MDAEILAWLHASCAEAEIAASKQPRSCTSRRAHRVGKQPMCLNATELAWLRTRCVQAETVALKQIRMTQGAAAGLSAGRPAWLTGHSADKGCARTVGGAAASPLKAAHVTTETARMYDVTTQTATLSHCISPLKLLERLMPPEPAADELAVASSATSMAVQPML